MSISREPKKFPVARKPRMLNRFKKFAILASTLIALSAGAPATANSNPQSTRIEQLETKQLEQSSNSVIPICFATGLALFAAVTLKMHLKHRNVGPWGTDRKKWGEHLETQREMEKRQDHP